MRDPCDLIGGIINGIHAARLRAVDSRQNWAFYYDTLNRLVVNYYTQYVYNALGVRVAKASIAGAGFPAAGAVCAAPGVASGFMLTNQYLLDQSGDQVTELNGSGTWLHSNVWAGAHLDATYDINGLHFHLADPLGTRRIETAAAGTIDGTYQSLPFGDNLVASGYDATEHHFTGKERDFESGNDYFGARYYASSIGRWMSPDWADKPEAVPYSQLDNPQSLNLYGYMGNNPLSKADKDGHCWPVCTAILGAGLGALAEAGTEYLKGETLSPYKIGAAALAGRITGAIAGPIGDAAELGVAAKVGGQLAANLIGGAVERKLNGQKVLDPKAAIADAAGAAATGKVAKGLEKHACVRGCEKGLWSCHRSHRRCSEEPADSQAGGAQTRSS
ncbi:MAG TPA: RHS repeat-associated core domain-containing protein [Acidisarcina sp.]